MSKVWMWPCSCITTHTALERLLMNIFEYLYGGLHHGVTELWQEIFAVSCKLLYAKFAVSLQKLIFKNKKKAHTKLAE